VQAVSGPNLPLPMPPVMLVSNAHKTGFKRTGKSDFVLPADFDEHFDDLNDEIATMFMGESL
jgi:hypothetical protein